MLYYVFERCAENSIRLIEFGEDQETGSKHVNDINEMSFASNKESLKKVVRKMMSLSFVGESGDYSIRSLSEYDPSMEGKARTRFSKEVNVMTEQLWNCENYKNGN